MDELQKYYEYLRKAGADVAPNFESFKRTLSDEKSGKQYYDYLKNNGYDTPETYESFTSTFGLKKKDGITTSSHTKLPLQKGSVTSGLEVDVMEQPIPQEQPRLEHTEPQKPLPTFTESQLGIDPISLSKQYNQLSKATRLENQSTNIGGMTMGGTSSVEVPDENARYEAEQIKKELEGKGFNVDKLIDQYRDIPDRMFLNPGWSKDELFQKEKDNPQGFERQLAAGSWQPHLGDALRGKVANGEISEEQYNTIWEKGVLAKQQATQNYSYRREDTKKALQLIDENITDEKLRERLKRAVAIDRSFTYGKKNEDRDKAIASDPRKDFLNENQILAMQYLEDTRPDEALGYNSILIDPKKIEGNDRAKEGWEEKASRLEQIGLGLKQTAVNEELNDLGKLAQGVELTPEQQNRVTELLVEDEKVKQGVAGLHTKYRTPFINEADEVAEELVGQGLTGGSYIMSKTGQSIGNTVKGIWDLVSEPFRSGESSKIHQLEAVGEGNQDRLVNYVTQKNKAIKDFEIKIEPDLQGMINPILNDKTKSWTEKYTTVAAFLRVYPEKWDKIPIQGGKLNISPSSLFYSIGDLAATLAPFIALEGLTGGGATAGFARKFLSTFTAAAATGFHESYEAAINEGVPNPFATALRVTAINSAALAGAGTPDAIRKLLGTKTAVGELVNKMSDQEIAAALKANSRAINAFGKTIKTKGITDVGKGLGRAFLESTKVGAKITAFTTGGEMINNALSEKDNDPEELFKHGLVSVLTFSVGGGLAGVKKSYDKVSGIQSSALVRASEQPEQLKTAAGEQFKNGSISRADYESIITNIDKAAEVAKKISFVGNNGKPLSEKNKGKLLLLKMAEKEIEEQYKGDISEKLKETKEEKLEELKTELEEVYKNKDVEPIVEPTPPTVKGEETVISKPIELSVEPTSKGERLVPEVVAGIKNNLGKRLKGDKLLDAEDLVDELNDNKAEIDNDGMVTVYHRTTTENKKEIERTGKMKGLEDGVFFSTKETGQNEGYGDAIIKLKVPVEKLELDDSFGSEAHLRIPTKKAGEIVNVKDYIPENKATEVPKGERVVPDGKIETDKAVMEGVKSDYIENQNGDKVNLPEPGFLIDGVSLKEGEAKGQGSGQEIYKKALDEHGILYSHWPMSEDAMRVHDKLVEKGIAKVENITLEDGTELRKITKIEKPNEGTNKAIQEAEGGKPPTEPPKPPIEPPIEEGGESKPKELRDKSLLNRLVEAENIPEASRAGFKEKGLKYDTSSQKEAEAVAKSIIDQYGIEDAVLLADAQKFDGDVNSLIYAESLNRLAKLESEAKTPQEKLEFAYKYAEVGIKYDEAARKGGRFNSAINYFYKKSPLGIKLMEEAKNKERFQEWSKNKEQSWKEVFEEMMKEPEFESIVKEKVGDELKKERSEARKTKKEKVHKAIDETMAKWVKLLSAKGGAEGAQKQGIGAEELMKAVGATTKKAYDAGEAIVKIIEDAVNYISENIGDNWDKEAFRKEQEKSLGKDGREFKVNHEKRIEYLKKELERVSKRMPKEPKVKGESKREIPKEEQDLIDQIEKEQSDWDAEKDADRKTADEYRLMETERNRQLKRVGEITEKIETLRKGQLPETKSREPKIDTPEIEALKAEKDALEKSVRESIAHEKKMTGLEEELQRLKDRKEKEPKPESKRVITEDERLKRDEIEAERKAWGIEKNIEKLNEDLQRAKDRKEKTKTPKERKELSDEENEIINKIKEEKEVWRKEVEPEKKVRQALKDAQKSYDEYVRRINEKDISTNESSTPETPQLKALREKRDAKRKEYEAMKKEMTKPTPDQLKFQQQERILERLRKKMKGMSEKDKEEVIRRAFKQTIENGGLKYDEFRDIIADVLGYGKMTEEQAAKLEELVETMNVVDEIGRKAREEKRTPEALKEYLEAKKKSEKAARDLSGMLYTKPKIISRLLTLMQLNTLGVPSLVNNPIFNIVNQAAVRFPIGLQLTLLDKALHTINKSWEPQTNIFASQGQFFSKLGRGTRESFEQLFNGLTSMDYMQKEIQASQIRPFKAAKELWEWRKGERKLTKEQAIDRFIQASPFGISAEAVARVLNIGDKPQRFAAEGAKGAVFAKNLGLKGMDFEYFMEFPKEEAYAQYKKKGLSDEAAMKKAQEIQDAIITQGQRSTFQEDNIVNDALNYLFEQKLGTGGKVVKMFNLPFVKIPLNAFWSAYNLINPEVAILQSAYYGSKAIKAKLQGKEVSTRDIEESKRWLAHATTGMAILATTTAMAKAGIFNAGNDDGTTKKERQAERQYEQQKSFNVDKFWAWVTGKDISKVRGGLNIDSKWLGVMGAVGNIQAKKWEEMTPEQREAGLGFMENMYENLTGSSLELVENGVFSNIAGLKQAIFKGGPAADNYFLNLMNMAGNIVQPATFAQWSRASLPYHTTVKADNFWGEVKNSLLARSSVVRTLSDKYPPSAIGIWGDELKKGDKTLLNLFGMSESNKDNFAQVLYEDYKKSGDLRFFPSAVKPEIQEEGATIKLNTEQARDWDKLVGQQRKNLIAPFVNDMATIPVIENGEIDDKTYSQIKDKDEKIKYLQKVYNTGLDQAKDLFFLKYPNLKPPEKDMYLEEQKKAVSEQQGYQIKSQN